MEKMQLSHLAECQAQFYKFPAEMRKGEGEECRYCHSMSAFIEKLIQIRAADEPMTRFMHCFNCNKNWRD